MAKTIILDLDYTMLDSKAFKEKVLASFGGMTAYEFNEFYRENFKDKKINYSPKEHLRLLANRGGKNGNHSLSLEAFNDFIRENISSFLFAGCEGVLRHYKENGDKLVLASFGNKEWQGFKIDSLKIDGSPAREYFDEVILEDKDKSQNETLQELSGKEIILIDDNAKEACELLEILGKKCQLYLIKGPYSENFCKENDSKKLKKHNISVYDNLSGLNKELSAEASSELSRQAIKVKIK